MTHFLVFSGTRDLAMNLRRNRTFEFPKYTWKVKSARNTCHFF